VLGLLGTLQKQNSMLFCLCLFDHLDRHNGLSNVLRLVSIGAHLFGSQILMDLSATSKMKPSTRSECRASLGSWLGTPEIYRSDMNF
jgi:hypothetical protein